MNRIFSTITVVLVAIAVSGCASGGFGRQEPGVVKLHTAIADIVDGKTVSIPAIKEIRGVIADAVLAAGGRLTSDRNAEVSITADIRHESHSGYNPGWEIIRTVPAMPVHRTHVDLWVSIGKETLYHAEGTSTHYGYGAERSEAARWATRQALARLRPLR